MDKSNMETRPYKIVKTSTGQVWGGLINSPPHKDFPQYLCLAQARRIKGYGDNIGQLVAAGFIMGQGRECDVAVSVELLDVVEIISPANREVVASIRNAPFVLSFSSGGITVT